MSSSRSNQMNTAIFNDKASMTSVEIAELVGS